MRLRFSEPSSEPIPDGKLRIMLGEMVQNSTTTPGGSVHIGGVTAIGTYVVGRAFERQISIFEV